MNVNHRLILKNVNLKKRIQSYPNIEQGVVRVAMFFCTNYMDGIDRPSLILRGVPIILKPLFHYHYWASKNKFDNNPNMLLKFINHMQVNFLANGTA